MKKKTIFINKKRKTKTILLVVLCLFPLYRIANVSSNVTYSSNAAAIGTEFAVVVNASIIAIDTHTHNPTITTSSTTTSNTNIIATATVNNTEEFDTTVSNTTNTLLRRKKKKKKYKKNIRNKKNKKYHNVNVNVNVNKNESKSNIKQQQEQHRIGRVQLFTDDDENSSSSSSRSSSNNSSSTIDESSISNCWISIENATFIGCGDQGQTFMTQMYCLSMFDNNNNKKISNTNKNETTPPKTTTRKKNVILKIWTTEPNKRKKGNYQCKSYTNSQILEYNQLYHTLFPSSPSSSSHTSSSSSSYYSNSNSNLTYYYHQHNNNNNNNNNNMMMKRHFNIPIGSVHEIPIDKFYSNLSNNITQINPKCGEIIHYNTNQKQHSEESVIMTGIIMEVAYGLPLFDYLKNNNNNNNNNKTTKITTTAKSDNHRRRNKNNIIIGRQLICIWRYMYRHHLLHEDITLRHIYYDDGDNESTATKRGKGFVTLIDFQKHDTINLNTTTTTTTTAMVNEENNNNNNNNNITTNRSGGREEQQLRISSKKKNKFKVILQLYQLLTIIAHLCMDEHDYMGIPTNVNLMLRNNRIKQTHNRMIATGNKVKKDKLVFALKQCFEVNKNENELLNENENTATTTTNTNNNNTKNVSSSSSSSSSSSEIIPSLLFEYYEQVVYDDGNETNINEEEDVVGKIYDILLSQWSASFGGDDDDGIGCF